MPLADLPTPHDDTLPDTCNDMVSHDVDYRQTYHTLTSPPESTLDIEVLHTVEQLDTE